MVKKNPRFRHKFNFSGSPEKKKEDPATRDDIVNSLVRQSRPGEHVLETGEDATEETAQPAETYEPSSVSRHGSARRWIATLTLLGVPAALWLSGLLPAAVVGAADSGLDYIVSKITSVGPILLGEIATMGAVIAILGMQMRRRSPSH